VLPNLAKAAAEGKGPALRLGWDRHSGQALRGWGCQLGLRGLSKQQPPGTAGLSGNSLVKALRRLGE